MVEYREPTIATIVIMALLSIILLTVLPTFISVFKTVWQGYKQSLNNYTNTTVITGTFRSWSERAVDFIFTMLSDIRIVAVLLAISLIVAIYEMKVKKRGIF